MHLWEINKSLSRVSVPFYTTVVENCTKYSNIYIYWRDRHNRQGMRLLFVHIIHTLEIIDAFERMQQLQTDDFIYLSLHVEQQCRMMASNIS